MKESVAIAKEANRKKESSPTKSDNSIQRLRDEPERQLGSLRGVIGNITREGGTPSVESLATELSVMSSSDRASALLALQQTHGNQYVQRVVTGIQAKLKVGQPGDKYEQEADRVADAVMHMSDPPLQRQPEEEEEHQVKELTSHTSEVNRILEARINALRGGGQLLPASTRAFFEPRFDYDFGGVRVHNDSEADTLNRVLKARAFTTGQDIFFRLGEYNPGSSSGRGLLAHELTHVVQQRGTNGRQANMLSINKVGSSQEHEAEAHAASVVLGWEMAVPPIRLHSHTPTLQRLGDPSQAPAGMSCPIARDSPAGGADIVFSKSVATLSPVQKASIASFVSSWQASGASATVRIDGYASVEGPQPLNWRLSCNRALAVRDELESPSTAGVAGISTSYISLFAQGETDEFSTGLAPNRRVVITTSIPAPPAPPVCTAPTNPDRSGRASNPTTASEAEVTLLNLYDAARAYEASGDAFAAAGASGLSGSHLGPQDAFRHCVWNCFMAQRIGASEAEKFGTAHENSNPSAIPFDNQMDLHNNAIGRSLGTPGANCEAECSDAVTSGRLRTIRGPHTRSPATPPVLTTCIGASDQPWP